jgi:hypothetical protein
MKTDLSDWLDEKRSFLVFVPDIEMKEAMKNEPYVLRIHLPRIYSFLEVVQIENPLVGISALGMGPQTAYAFLVDPTTEVNRRFYITAIFPHMHFPWGDTRVRCSPRGISTHSGVALLHVETNVEHDDYDWFERNIQEMGYRLVDAKPYTQSAELVNLYKANLEELRGKVEEQVRPPGPGVGQPSGEGPEGSDEPA